MYLGITVENFVTVGLMLLIWMLVIHTIAQVGIRVPSWLPGAG